MVEDKARACLERLTVRADLVQRGNPNYVRELNAWTTYWNDEGVPVGHIPRHADVPSSDVLNRRFPNGVMDDPEIDPNPRPTACC